MRTAKLNLAAFAGIVLYFCMCLILAPQSAHAQGKTILIFAPHPDDEALCCSGIISAARLRGDTVKVVVVTNGDFTGGTATGYTREGESINAMSVLGMNEQDIIFLGYGDQTLKALYENSSPTYVIQSAAGQKQTYGNRGLGHIDYHTYLTGAPGPYNHQTILSDFEAVLKNFHPDDIYVTGLWDSHPDHRGTFTFLTEALNTLRTQGAQLSPTVHETVIHAPDDNCSPVCSWPPPGLNPSQPYPMPQYLLSNTTYEWNKIESIPVPASMQDPNQSTNLKAQVIAQYVSQGGSDPNNWLFNAVKKNEFFWIHDYSTNLAGISAVTVSSEASQYGQLGVSAVDGFVDGNPDYNQWEWSSNGELSGAWIQLAWPNPVTLSQVVLHDRPNLSDNVTSGTLSFSDGSSVPVGQLPNNANGLLVSFPQKSVSWIRFTVNGANGQNIGLSEIEVYGKASSSAVNSAPQIYQGPVADNTSLTNGQTPNLSVTVFDVDADPLTYTWTTDGGTITGAGSNVVFNPPAVTATTIFTITLNVSDGKGGTSQNSTFITVTPPASSGTAISALSLNPATVGGGLSSTGTLTLAGPAPAGGAVVSLSSDTSSAASVPATATVPAGSTSTTFPVTTYVVASPVSVTLTAAYSGSTLQATLRVGVYVPPSLATIATVTVSSQDTVDQQQGYKAIDGIVDGSPSPPGDYTKEWASNGELAGAWIRLTWNVPVSATAVTLYDRINQIDNVTSGTLSFSDRSTVAVGALPNSGTGLTVSFPAKTVTWMQFTVNSAVGQNIGLAEISVSGTLAQANITALTLSPAAVTGGTSSTATVTLNSAAPSGGASIAISSNNAAAQVPPSVTVAAGATSATVAVTTIPVGTSTPVSISGTYNGTAGATLTVNPPSVSAVSLNPTSVLGGTSATGTVTLNSRAPASGATVTLSSNSAAAIVPNNVTIAAGNTSANFSVSTTPVGPITTATISGSFGGATKSANLTVNPPAVASVSANPTTVIGLTSSTGTITLTGPAPAGGIVVTISDNSSAVSTPATVTVPAGASSVTFKVGTSLVLLTKTVTITASIGGASKATTLTLLL